MFLSTKKTEPAHYMLTIESFSILSEAGTVQIESDVFEASGHKWRLQLYPNGKEEKTGVNHISLYLIICNTQSLSKGWKLDVNVKFFIYDHIGHHYVSFEGLNGDMTRFHENQMKWGFDELVSVDRFKESSNGYLFNDSCVFGAEVFPVPKYKLEDGCFSMIKPALNMNTYSRTFDKVSAVVKEYFKVAKVNRRLKEGVNVDSETFAVPKVTEFTLKDRCLSMIKPPKPMNTYSWTVDKFSAVTENHLTSEVFKVGKLKWTLSLYPKGNGSGAGTHLSVFLDVHEAALLPDGWRVYAKYELCVKNQSGHADRVKATNKWFCKSNNSWGSQRFMQLCKVGDISKGFLLNDRLIVEAKISVIGMLRNFI